MNDTDAGLSFDIPGIQKCQQNRYPLLFVDRITDLIPGKRARGIKTFTYNEWFFPAHFADEPTVPGFIMVECLVQTFIMIFLSRPEYQGMKTAFSNISDFQFKRKIVPGESLDILAILDSFNRGVAKGRATGHVAGELACAGEFVIAAPDVLKQFTPRPPTSS